MSYLDWLKKTGAYFGKMISKAIQRGNAITKFVCKK